MVEKKPEIGIQEVKKYYKKQIKRLEKEIRVLKNEIRQLKGSDKANPKVKEKQNLTAQEQARNNFKKFRDELIEKNKDKS